MQTTKMTKAALVAYIQSEEDKWWTRLMDASKVYQDDATCLISIRGSWVSLSNVLIVMGVEPLRTIRALEPVFNGEGER